MQVPGERERGKIAMSKEGRKGTDDNQYAICRSLDLRSPEESFFNEKKKKFI